MFGQYVCLYEVIDMLLQQNKIKFICNIRHITISTGTLGSFAAGDCRKMYVLHLQHEPSTLPSVVICLHCCLFVKAGKICYGRMFVFLSTCLQKKKSVLLVSENMFQCLILIGISSKFLVKFATLGYKDYIIQFFAYGSRHCAVNPICQFFLIRFVYSFVELMITSVQKYLNKQHFLLQSYSLLFLFRIRSHYGNKQYSRWQLKVRFKCNIHLTK